jgi:AhpD family alkylhydroperoxidase
VTVKTDVSRFQIHDELTAPDESAPLIKTIQATGGAVTKFVGVLAGAPAVLRAYTRMRSELRGGVLPRATRERIALAVAEYRDDTYSIAQHAKSARSAGLGLDEVSRARSFSSADEELLEAVAHLVLNEFQSLIAGAAELPKDQSGPRVLPSVA